MHERRRAQSCVMLVNAANDNEARLIGFSAGPMRRDADRMRSALRRLQAAAERASLDGLAHILAMAAQEAQRIAEWEGRIEAELAARPGSRYPADR